MCEFNSFKSIFHKNNDLNMLRHDYLHLGPAGTFLLTRTFANVFNGADWQFWPLINEINNDNIEVCQGINVNNDQAQRTVSSENSEPSSNQGPENDLLLLHKQKKAITID